MEIKKLFEESVETGWFTDYDVCIKGPVEIKFSGGRHVSQGARLFDVASLTKACTHLLLLKMFVRGELSPESSFARFVPAPQHLGDDRQLWHFLCYAIQNYNFDYEALRDGTTKTFKEELVSKGFGRWSKRFKYDNIASAYLAILLEKLFGGKLEEILRTELLGVSSSMRENFVFHPVKRGLVTPEMVVPTRQNNLLRGRVHDPLSFQHEDTDLSVAGLFSNAETLAEVFHENVNELISAGFYDEVAKNQLMRIGVGENAFGLGFDIPFAMSLQGFNVEGPLIFAGWTGCRVFFTKRPRITICFLTNRVFCSETQEARMRSREFSWSVIREALRCAV